jgi:hypothetical protein
MITPLAAILIMWRFTGQSTKHQNHNAMRRACNCPTDRRIEKLLSDEGIVRNKLKIYAIINNAKRFVEIQKENGSFDKYSWQFTKGKTIKNHR